MAITHKGVNFALFSSVGKTFSSMQAIIAKVNVTIIDWPSVIAKQVR